jgi:UDP-N-acetylglucosamine acyltransferase
MAINKIHKTAIIEDGAEIGNNVEIGPFSIIGKNVKIGDNTILKSHIIIEGNTQIGQNNIFYPFSTIGVAPQDLKFKGEDSKVVIGDNNTIREHVTIHRGTKDGSMVTKIGNNSLLMVGVHIAHDCQVGNRAILANNATLAGHVILEDDVIIGGLSALHQFVRVGKGAMIGGMSGVESDVIPYGLVVGERASLAGLNLIGMKRTKIERDEIHALRNFFKEVFIKKNENFLEKVKEFSAGNSSKTVAEVVNFLTSKSSRSFCQVK